MTLLRIYVSIVILMIGMAEVSCADEATPGICHKEPSSGFFVKVEQGYMVPYKTKIPGTDVEFEMVPIRGGTFKMGSPPSEQNHQEVEGPQITVEVAPFWMGKCEVTWAEYKSYMKMHGVFKEFESRDVRPVTEENQADAVTAPTKLYDPSFTYEYGEDPQQPAVTMTQYAAKQYTKWLTGLTGQQYRLPSDAEWEYACRAGAATAYHFGDDPAKLGEYAWYYDNSNEKPNQVGQKKPNPWGLYDMHGNVWEWVLDEYREDGYQWLADKKKVAGTEAIAWPTQAYPRTVRGGSWDDDAEDCRAAAKMGSDDEEWKEEDPNLPLSPWWFTSDPSRAVGFRLLRSLSPLPKTEMAKYWEPDVEDIKLDVEDRLLEGRAVRGLIDEHLPAAMEQLKLEPQ